MRRNYFHFCSLCSNGWGPQRLLQVERPFLRYRSYSFSIFPSQGGTQPPTYTHSLPSPSDDTPPLLHAPFCVPMPRFNPFTAAPMNRLEAESGGEGRRRRLGERVGYRGGRISWPMIFFCHFQLPRSYFPGHCITALINRCRNIVFIRDVFPGEERKHIKAHRTSRETLTYHYLSEYLDREKFSRFRR